MQILFYYKDFFSGASLSPLFEIEKLKDTLLNSAFYFIFLNQHHELILSSYITGRILPLNMDFISHELGDWDKTSEYYQNLGIKCDYSKEHQEFKEELLYSIKSDNQDKEKIKRLLRERKYI